MKWIDIDEAYLIYRAITATEVELQMDYKIPTTDVVEWKNGGKWIHI